MKHFLLLLLFCPVLLASQACEQVDFREFCPVADQLDPNESGVVLGPVPDDPNEWAVTAGPWTRAAGLACDAEGDKFEIQVATPHWVVTRDAGAGVWRLSGEVRIGLNVIRVQAMDKWEAVSSFLVVVLGVAPEQNTAPVLR